MHVIQENFGGNMSGILIAILEMIIVYHANYIEGRHSIAYVLVPLSFEAAMRMVCSFLIITFKYSDMKQC